MPKFHIGRPLPHSISLVEGWMSIRTLDQSRLTWSLCIGICVALFIALIWKHSFGESLPFGVPHWTEILIFLFILSIGHEAAHLVAFPSCGLNSRTVIGVWLETGSPYVQYMLPMKRNRFLVVTMLPFLVLSIFPFALAYRSIYPIEHLSWISVLNCVGAGSDIFVAFQVVFTVPAGSQVIEGEDALYWR